MISRSRLTAAALVTIILAYLFIAVQYARLTPPWQAPDEPAHFNYVRHVAERGELPVLQAGDFPSAYLEKLKARRFPPEMPIDSIRYQAWQPPLYYILAAGVYRLTWGLPLTQQLLAVRLFSVACGALLLVVAWRAIATLAPGRPWLSLGTTALMAAIPMHVAMLAAVNNDVLAGLWVALVLWQLFALLQGTHGSQGYTTAGDAATRLPESLWRRPLARWAILGVTLGLAGLTKLSTFMVAPLVLATLVYAAWRQAPGRRWGFALSRLAAVVLPTTLLLLPWLAHNASIYGLADPLAYRRHDAVVVGQLRTADWIARVGMRQAVRDSAVTTFRSFWGKFGWMGVPIDARIYRGLAALTGLALLGLLLRLPRARRDWQQSAKAERVGLLLLAALATLSGLGLVWYNLSFVQHQGRYLFPALAAIALFLVIGWREVTRRAWRLPVAALLLAAAALLAGQAILGHEPMDKWTIAGLVSCAGGMALAAWLPERWASWLYALPYPLLLALTLLCLYAFILPALA